MHWRWWHLIKCFLSECNCISLLSHLKLHFGDMLVKNNWTTSHCQIVYSAYFWTQLSSINKIANVLVLKFWRNRIPIQPWPPGSPGTSRTTAAPSGIRPTWWPTPWCWSSAGSWRRRRDSTGSGRTSTAASRPVWTTAGWLTRLDAPTPSAPARSWAWRICAPRCRPPVAALSYSSKRAGLEAHS